MNGYFNTCHGVIEFWILSCVLMVLEKVDELVWEISSVWMSFHHLVVAVKTWDGFRGGV